MNRVISCVFESRKPTAAELVLEGQVISQNLGKAEVSVEDLRKSDVLRKRGVRAWIDRAKGCGKWVCHARSGIRIGEIGVGDIYDGREGRNAHDIFKRYTVGRLVIIPCSTTDAGLGIGR